LLFWQQNKISGVRKGGSGLVNLEGHALKVTMVSTDTRLFRMNLQ